MVAPVRSGSIRTRTVAAALILATACSPSPISFENGLAVGYVPPGFEYSWNEITEFSAAYHFESVDGADFCVTRVVGGDAGAIPDAEVVEFRGLDFFVVRGHGEIRVSLQLDEVVVSAASRDLEMDLLVRITDSMRYDPAADELSQNPFLP